MNQIVTIQNLLSAEECRGMIERLESIGFHEQWTGDQDRVIRTRCILEDRVVTADLWPKVAHSIPRLTDIYHSEFLPIPTLHFPLAAYRPCGLNEMLRCYKYKVGEQFRRHEDFAHEWSERKRSFSTVLIYLNADFTGGETRFDDDVISPQTGLAAIFPHELMHEGLPVKSGVKYTLRSDIVFEAEDG